MLNVLLKLYLAVTELVLKVHAGNFLLGHLMITLAVNDVMIRFYLGNLKKS